MLAAFIVAFTCAYLVDPVVTTISVKLKVGRSIAASITLFFSIFLITLLGYLLLPLIYSEISLLFAKIPDCSKYVQDFFIKIHNKIYNFQPELASKITSVIQNSAKYIFSILSGQLKNFFSGALATINFFGFFFLALFLLFYLMKDMPKIASSIINLVPLKHHQTIVLLLKEINSVISRYIRGQALVCLIFMIFYAMGFSVIGVNFALLLGILSGMLMIIPFIGILFSALLSLIIAINQFGFGVHILYILILYLLCYLADNIFITPRIIGDKIGLHPLWTIIAIVCCGKILGFVGIILAVPIAGITRTCILFLVKIYKKSKWYRC